MAQTTVVSPYADYQFYKDVYHGVGLSEDDFIRLEARAEEELDAMTFHRIPIMEEKYMTDQIALDIRKAVCAMSELMKQGETIGVGISSESNDGYSVSYSQNATKEMQNRMKNAASKYLADSGLLYRGGGAWHDN